MRRGYLALLPLALAGCGGGGGSATPVNGDPLAAAADATAKQSSEQVTMQAKIDLSGQTLSLDGSGGFAKTKGELHLLFSVGDLGSSNLDEVFDGNTVWIRSPLLTSSLKGKQWIRVDLAKQAQVLGFNLPALAGQTPSSALEQLRSGGAVSKLGTDTIQGVETTHYREKLGGTYKSVEAWVDGNDLVRKVRLDFTAPVSGKQRAHTVLTMTFSDFGSKVTVTQPDPAVVIDASEVSAK